MLEYTSVYGYIRLDSVGKESYDEAVTYIRSLGADASFPFINANMFSFGNFETPYYYENVMFGFAATYKNFGIDISDWELFILKIENILRNIKFESAQFHTESYEGDITLYWHNLQLRFDTSEDENHPLYRLIKTDEWYFGFGRRSVFLGLLDETQTYHEWEDLRFIKSLDFKYPVPKNKYAHFN